MKNTVKKFWATALCLCLMLTLNISSFAAEPEEDNNLNSFTGSMLNDTAANIISNTGISIQDSDQLQVIYSTETARNATPVSALQHKYYDESTGLVTVEIITFYDENGQNLDANEAFSSPLSRAYTWSNGSYALAGTCNYKAYSTSSGVYVNPYQVSVKSTGTVPKYLEATLTATGWLSDNNYNQLSSNYTNATITKNVYSVANNTWYARTGYWSSTRLIKLAATYPAISFHIAYNTVSSGSGAIGHTFVIA